LRLQWTFGGLTVQDYLKQAKSFLAQNSARLALRAIPMALVAVAAANATPTFNAPTTTSITSANTCSGGTTGSLTGSPANGGAEMSLSGNAYLNFSDGPCSFLMVWKGTGSGALGGASYSASFNIAPPGNVTVTAYTLTVLINGVAQTPVTCSYQIQETAFKPSSRLKPKGEPVGCDGNITVPLTNISASGSLSTYEADLSVTGFWSNNTLSTLTVSIPTGATIDIFATGPTVTAAPALSPVALAGTALLLALAAFRMSRWKTSDGSSPGPQA
jgi:hypothetical protein